MIADDELPAVAHEFTLTSKQKKEGFKLQGPYVGQRTRRLWDDSEKGTAEYYNGTIVAYLKPKKDDPAFWINLYDQEVLTLILIEP